MMLESWLSWTSRHAGAKQANREFWHDMRKPLPTMKALDSKSVKSALSPCAGPAWLIDAAAGRVVGANSAGAERLGLRVDAASGTLDAGMPGLARLRDIAGTAAIRSARRETLEFWTAYGVEQLLCDIKPIVIGKDSLLLVSVYAKGDQAELFDAESDAMQNDSVDDASSGDSGPRDQAQDDAATLRQIAQAIRAGGKQKRKPVPESVVATGESAGESASVSPLAILGAAKPAAAGDASSLPRLAHELKTPLSAIVAAAEIMKDERLGPMANKRYLEYSADIRINALHALAVIDRMLSSQSGEAALPIGQFEPIDLQALIEQIASGARPLADKYGVVLIAETESALPAIKADPTALRQMIFNLLANAFRFAGNGGEVRLQARRERDGSVHVVVRNTGTVITTDDINDALAMSKEGQLSRRAHGGMGLGLAVVRELALFQGAVFSIKGVPGQGTTAEIIFPPD